MGVFKNCILYDVIEPVTNTDTNLYLYSLITVPEELEKTEAAYAEYAKNKIEQYNGISLDNYIIKKSSVTELDDKIINFIDTEAFGTQKFSGSELSQYFYDLIDTKNNTVETIILKPGVVNEEPTLPEEPIIPEEPLIFAGGTGTKEDPYLIETATQLDAIRNDLTASYKLIDDIDLTYDTTNENGLFYNEGKGWIPIGRYEIDFSGNFDGNNKTITGMTQKITRNETDEYSGYCDLGLFVNVSGTISDLNIKDVNINFEYNANVNTLIYISALTGKLTGTVNNVSTSGTINADIQEFGNPIPMVCIGGIAGRTTGSTITNCINETEILVTGSYSSGSYGGIVGSTRSGLIQNTINYGNITTNQTSTGGIVGDADCYDGNLKIENCTNYGNIKSNGSIGGIVGHGMGITILSSKNYASLSSSNSIGGIAGSFSGYTDSKNNKVSGIIEECFNAGEINLTIHSNGVFTRTGGIVGCGWDNQNIINSFNTGKIILPDYKSIRDELYQFGVYVGGIAGTNNGNIYTSYNAGIVVDKYNSAIANSMNINSIVGMIENDNSIVQNCYYYDNGLAAYTNINGEKIYNNSGLNFNEMKLQNSYIGFDFENIWNMRGNEIYLFPELNNNVLEGKFINSIEITNTDLNVIRGKTLQLNTSVNPSDAGNKNIIWSIENVTGEATISETGLVSAIKKGTVKVKATAADLGLIYDEVEINILPVPVSFIEIVNKDLNVIKGETLQLSAGVLPYDADNKNIIWTIENVTGEATITETGLVSATKVGTVKVKATAADLGLLYDEVEINILSIPVESVEITNTNLNLINGETLQLNATVNPSDADNKNIVWSIENVTGEATITETGLVSATKAGTVKVKATAEDLGIIYDEVEINILPITVASVEITNTDLNIKNGETLQLNATVNPSDADNKNIVWSIENVTGEATISEAGLVSATKAGTVKVKATAEENNDIYDEVEIIIQPNIISYTSNDNSILYDGKTHSIELKVDTENVTIKYMDEKGSYTLDNKPEYNKVGEYTISYQITKDNYDTVKASNKLYIYGIKDFDNTMQINNNILKVKDYTFSMQTLYRKFNIFANTANYKHLNSKKENITDDLLKTGDYIEILINGVKAYTYQISVSGDVNSDGKISALDYVKIKNHIMGTNIIDNEINQAAADANNDEKISALDYVRIKNIIMNGGV